jgi:hypothetical protein
MYSTVESWLHFQRQTAMKLKPVDSNAATHLIRCALGGVFIITYQFQHCIYLHVLQFCIVVRHGTTEYQSRGIRKR